VAKHLVKIRYAKNVKAFGKTIRKIRKEQGLTLEDLAFKAGISYNSLNTIETGKLNPTLATICAIAEALGLEVRDLF
jgi:transcriptional regulator with XRE-family HTH domain